MKPIEIVALAPWQRFIIITVLAFCLCSCRQPISEKHAGTQKLSDKQVAVLNSLRDEVNLTYGYVDGWPRTTAAHAVASPNCSNLARTRRRRVYQEHKFWTVFAGWAQVLYGTRPAVDPEFAFQAPPFT